MWVKRHPLLILVGLFQIMAGITIILGRSVVLSTPYWIQSTLHIGQLYFSEDAFGLSFIIGGLALLIMKPDRSWFLFFFLPSFLYFVGNLTFVIYNHLAATNSVIIATTEILIVFTAFRGIEKL